jgi:hypothetical protein
MDKLTLDIVGVIVVLTEDIVAEVLMFERVGMSWMAMATWFEFMKSMSGVRRVADKC